MSAQESGLISFCWNTFGAINVHLKDDLARDANYKKFVLAVDRILLSFDAINEWADIITFLTRLNKVWEIVLSSQLN